MNKKNLMVIGLAILGVVMILVAFFLMNNKNESITYQVTFDSNGGTLIEKQTINKGEKVSRPEDPKREGYFFMEWQLDGKAYDFNSEVIKDIVLVAKWMSVENTTEKFVVKFDSDGGTTISNQVVDKGSKVIEPTTPTREGYTFVEWQLDGKAYDFNSSVESNIELKAKWEKNEYTVTFNSDGGTSVKSQTIYEGSKATKPANPTREGYTFVEWQLDGKTYDFNTKVTKDITLKAVWKEIKSYTVSFNSDGGTSVKSQTIYEGSKATKPANPTKEGYNFDGWTLNGNNYDFNTAVNGNITLVARWTQKNYTVVAKKADLTTPFSRKLVVYEEGVEKTVKTIQYMDGVTLCQGTNPNVNYYAIYEETQLRLLLNSGTIVTASLTIEN